MASRRTVAPLAVDSFGQRTGESWLRLQLLMTGGNLRVRVVAEHALVIDLAAGIGLIGRVVPWVHAPVAALLGVPAERKLLQSAGSSLMEESSGVAAGSHDKV